jgi:MinD superfamily P-loop ATPase
MIIAVASGKGGTGKTLLATALALSAAECTYIDLDVEEPNGAIFLKPDIREEIAYTVPVPNIDKEKCTFCGLCSKACVYHALVVIPTLKKIMQFPELCHSCGVCDFVCPVEGTVRESHREIGKIRQGNRGTIQFIEGRLNIGQPSAVPLISGITSNYINEENQRLFFLDSSPGTACPVVETLKKSDYVLLVTEPTPFGLNDLELAVELVQDMGKKAGIIINKDDERQTLITDFCQRVHLPILLRIPYSLEIQGAYSRGIPLTEVRPGIKVQLKNLIGRITAGQWKKNGNEKP